MSSDEGNPGNLASSAGYFVASTGHEGYLATFTGHLGNLEFSTGHEGYFVASTGQLGWFSYSAVTGHLLLALAVADALISAVAAKRINFFIAF